MRRTACLDDRVRIARGELPRSRTQGADEENGQWRPWLLADPGEVDRLRADAEPEPLATYVTRMNEKQEASTQ